MRPAFWLVLALTALQTTNLPGTVQPFPYVVSLLAFGAHCDGSTDDSGAIQAAFAAAVANNQQIAWPAATCVANSALTLGWANSNPYAHVSILGASEDKSILKYGGSSTSITFLTLEHEAYVSFAHLQVVSNNQTTGGPGGGSTIGVLVTGSASTGGTESTTINFDHVSFSGWHVGLQVGAADAGSEIRCEDCGFSYNDNGFTGDGYNALNFTFVNPHVTANGCGFLIGGMGSNDPRGSPFTSDSHVSDGVKVFGGDTANNQVGDVCVGNTFGNTVLSGIRAETHNRFLLNSGPAGTLELANLNITGTSAGDSIVIDLTNGLGLKTAIHNSLINGIILLPNDNAGSWIAGQLELVDNAIMPGSGGTGAGALPFKFNPADTNMNNRVALTAERNSRYESNQITVPYPDLAGYVQDGVFYPVQRLQPAQVAGNGAPTLQLMGVRALALGSPADGRNLRDQCTFATSGSCAYTFQRTWTVTGTNGGTTLTLSSGTATPLDLGKSIALANASCCPSSGYYTSTGVIAAYASSTSVTYRGRGSDGGTYSNLSLSATGQNYNGTDNLGAGGGLTATVGENEPDANYRIVGMTCSANETFYVDFTSFATSGFTIHSSNSSSTATCAFLVVR